MRRRVEDPVTAEQRSRTPVDLVDDPLGRIVVDHRGVQACPGADLDDRIGGFALEHLGGLGDRVPDDLVQAGGLSDGYVLGTAGTVEVLPAGQPVAHVRGQFAARGTIPDASQRGLGAAGHGPGRQQRGQQSRARAVRVLVDGQVDLAGGGLEQSQQLVEQVFVADELEVRDVQPRAGFAAGIDELAHRGQRFAGLVAHMRNQRDAVLGGHRSQRPQFAASAVHAGRVDHSEAQRGAAGRQGRIGQRLHLP
ncbi:hypothetical protein SDC9_103057 [bioreactor metagenome]|uniref:Uncharacterized protein n=1 Tax=bioreactor metagenome TaxID=1076179 RepID=A0A645ASK2_9ZZZZ